MDNQVDLNTNYWGTPHHCLNFVGNRRSRFMVLGEARVSIFQRSSTAIEFLKDSAKNNENLCTLIFADSCTRSTRTRFKPQSYHFPFSQHAEPRASWTDKSTLCTSLWAWIGLDDCIGRIYCSVVGICSADTWVKSSLCWWRRSCMEAGEPNQRNHANSTNE